MLAKPEPFEQAVEFWPEIHASWSRFVSRFLLGSRIRLWAILRRRL
jgi:hypothetical protein